MNQTLEHTINTLENEKKQLEKENDRLIIQIETCDQMINGYNKKLKENDNKIESIKYVLEML